MSNKVFETAASTVQARNRIREHIYETPLLPAQHTGKANGSTILFKAENFQHTGSFKIRGAMSKLSAQTNDERLITASSGNHGIATARAAKMLSKKVTVVVPETVVQAKLQKIQAYGVDIIFHGTDGGYSEQHAQHLAASEGYTYVSPYNDPDVVAGQGTIALEMLEQCKNIDNVFVAMGGGGLISGIGSVLKAFSPQTKIFGVAASNTKALAESMIAGHVVDTKHEKTLADGVAGGMDTDSITLSLAMSVVDQVIECNEDEIRDALKTLAFDEGLVVEGSAALALAGYDKVAETVSGQTSVIVLCGANVDRDVVKNVIFGG
ncbi:threonine dehydratase [Plenodomus tracheiphilus IPT5]|uniref:Threonine dehydratase n=1 Tax=Plenodomus tracheiphilus IPT5 TaxID=1408161 RepID=A0A6A7AN93_9PLEO|nr:threonine dehydratase [Plenodomus tracheiphilus IPT5]